MVSLIQSSLTASAELVLLANSVESLFVLGLCLAKRNSIALKKQVHKDITKVSLRCREHLTNRKEPWDRAKMWWCGDGMGSLPFWAFSLHVRVMMSHEGQASHGNGARFWSLISFFFSPPASFRSPLQKETKFELENSALHWATLMRGGEPRTVGHCVYAVRERMTQLEGSTVFAASALWTFSQNTNLCHCEDKCQICLQIFCLCS